MNHIRLKREVSKILQRLSTDDFEKRTFSVKKFLEKNYQEVKMYTKRELRNLRASDEINDEEEGFMYGYLTAYKKRRF